MIVQLEEAKHEENIAPLVNRLESAKALYKSLTGIYAIAVVIAAALLYFVYCLYERDFLWCSLTAAFGSFLLLAGRSVSPLISFGALALAIVLSIAVILLFLFRKETSPVTHGQRTKVTDYVPTVLLVGTVLTLIAASFVSLAFMGFAGIVDSLFA